MKVIDIARAINDKARLKIIGIRPGEKIHEQMISNDEASCTYEYKDYYKILPLINDWYKDKNRIKKGKKVPPNFCYNSLDNPNYMTIENLQMDKK